jgi:hypothetical protein
VRVCVCVCVCVCVHRFEVFVDERAPMEVNVSSEQRCAVQSLIEDTERECSATMFDECQEEIYKLMERDSYVCCVLCGGGVCVAVVCCLFLLCLHGYLSPSLRVRLTMAGLVWCGCVSVHDRVASAFPASCVAPCSSP